MIKRSLDVKVLFHTLKGYLALLTDVQLHFREGTNCLGKLHGKGSQD